MAYTYYELKNGKTVDYSQHKFLLLPPLILIVVFCFGWVTMDSRNATTTAASQAKTNSSAQQDQLSQPQNLPTMTSVPAANGNQNSTPAANNTGPSQASTTAPNDAGQQHQSGAPNNPAPAAPTSRPSLNNTLKTITDNLPLF